MNMWLSGKNSAPRLCEVCGEVKDQIRSRGFGGDGATVESKCECGAYTITRTKEEFRGYELPENELDSIFLIADIPIERKWKLQNQYWNSQPHAHPWWLVKTPYGLIEIGWRKRVISIDWTDTKVRHIVTEDQVTKDESSVHAYSLLDATKYMAEWAKAARKLEASA